MSEEDVPQRQETTIEKENVQENSEQKTNKKPIEKLEKEPSVPVTKNEEDKLQITNSDSLVEETKKSEAAPVSSTESLPTVDSSPSPSTKMETDAKQVNSNGKLNQPKTENADDDSKNNSSINSEEADSSVNQSTNDSMDENVAPNIDSSSNETPGGRSKRQRKKVERFVQETKKEEVQVEVTGRGTALGEIAFIDHMITKSTPEVLKLIHRVAYGRTSSGIKAKRNLKKFKGFGFTESDVAYERKKTTVEKIFLPELKKILDILGLERSGVKNELVERLFKFLLNPVDNGKALPQSKRKSKGDKKERKSKKAKTEGEKPKKKKKAKKDEALPAPDGSDSSSGSEETQESDQKATQSDAESEPEEKPKVKAPPKKTPKKSTPKRPASTMSSDANDKPDSKKAKKGPTDSDIKTFIKKTLDKANLEEVTMKKLCQQVYDNYPSHDLSHKKDFIKSTVKSILS